MKLSKKVKRIITNRGLSLDDLKIIEEYPVYDLINMAKGSEQFIKNIMENKIVGILYDVDTDGVSAGKIMTNYLRALDITHKYTMNKSKQHGMNSGVIDWVKKENIDYLIVVDAGTNDIEYYKELESMGVDVLVLDHHLVSSLDILKATDSIVIINNNYEGSKNRYLSGTGVVYRFIKNVNKTFEIPNIENYKIWVGLSVLSDRCNMLNKENRYYVKYLYDNYTKEELFNKFDNYGSLENMFNFKVIPLINSCIRMDRQELVMELVNNRHPKSIDVLIKESLLVQKEQKELVEDALEEIVVVEKTNFLVARIDGEKYGGIIGLISANLKNTYGKPNIVITKEKDMYRGSFRGTDIVDSITLEHIGIENKGHKKACGVFINEEEYKEKITKLLNLVVEKTDVLLYEYIASEPDFYNYHTDIWEIALLNEYSGEGFEKIKVQINGIAVVPRVKEFEKMTRYKYPQFEIVDFDLDRLIQDEKTRKEKIVTPVLNKKGFILVRE